MNIIASMIYNNYIIDLSEKKRKSQDIKVVYNLVIV